ncbi:MAG: patatin [Burkholderiaceae bacterium]|nr:MAG: patatin [Burkholderiaceae bacterium]
MKFLSALVATALICPPLSSFALTSLANSNTEQSSNAVADSALNPKPQNTTRPKICLVLSGGGARGFAHIGVLKQLEAMRVPIDCVTGTSMGAVIGGLYASGMSASEIEKRIVKLQINDIAVDRVERNIVPHALREEDKQYPLGATMGLSADGVRFPSGAVQATQFLELLHNWTAHLKSDLDFDDLPVPFRAVATDLETGKTVIFNKGPLHLAIRASMAAPGMFAPVEIDGRLLTDGGLVKNLPVDIAKQMGADVIIAVNIGTPLLPRNQLSSLINVSQQMVNILTEQNVEQQKALLTSDDILIEPNLGEIRFVDFDRSAQAAEIGHKATVAMREKLMPYSVSKEEYAAHSKHDPDAELPPIKIGFVEVTSNGVIPEREIRRQVDVKVGAPYSAEEINVKLAKLNLTREYDGITHELVQRDGQYGVKIKANERNWGPHYLRFGLALSSGFEGTGGFRLQVGHSRPWLNDSGMEWRNDLEFGNTLHLRSELRQPVTEDRSRQLAPYIEVNNNTRNIYRDETRIAEYDFKQGRIGLDYIGDIGERGSLGEYRFGVEAKHYKVRPKIGMLQINDDQDTTSFVALPGVNLHQGGLKASVSVDQLSDPAFPRHGYAYNGEMFIGRYIGGERYQELNLSTTWAKSWNSHSLNLKFSTAGLFLSNKEMQGLGPTLGGFQQLSAYQPDQFFGNFKLYGSATYLYRALKFDLAGQSLFMGSSFEFGNVWNESSQMSFGKTRKSLSLFAGFNSFMGPMHVGFALAPNGVKNLFFQVGRQ